MGVGGVILPWHPTFNRADMNWFRVAFYVTLAATGFAPIFQLSWTRSPEWAGMFYAPIGKSITVYLVGALIYAGQVSPPKLVAERALIDGAFRYLRDGCMAGSTMLEVATTFGIWRSWAVFCFIILRCRVFSRWPSKGARRSADLEYCRGEGYRYQETVTTSSAEW